MFLLAFNMFQHVSTCFGFGDGKAREMLLKVKERLKDASKKMRCRRSTVAFDRRVKMDFSVKSAVVGVFPGFVKSHWARNQELRQQEKERRLLASAGRLQSN